MSRNLEEFRRIFCDDSFRGMKKKSREMPPERVPSQMRLRHAPPRAALCGISWHGVCRKCFTRTTPLAPLASPAVMTLRLGGTFRQAETLYAIEMNLSEPRILKKGGSSDGN